MRQVASTTEFLDDPVGKWCAAGCGLAWCHSEALCGAVVWGAPKGPEIAELLRLFRALFTLPGAADVILDGKRVERVEPDALEVALEWLNGHRPQMLRHVRLQIGVIGEGLAAVTMMGLLPIVGDTHPFRVVRDARDALREVAPAELVDGLHDELERNVAVAMDVAPIVQRLRDAIDIASASTSIHDAARRMALSTRTLQRALGAAGTSFQAELRAARFDGARRLLESTDQKIAAVASAVGLSEGALTQLFKERASATPAEYRKRFQATDR